MSKLLVLLFFLGASLAEEQSEAFLPSVLMHRVIGWAEQAAEAAASEVREAAFHLQQVTTMAEKLDVQRLTQLYQQNRHFIHHCNFASELGFELQGLSSCINITGDLANMTVLALYGYELADQLGGSVVDVLNELKECPEESFLKQIICYKHAFADIQGDIKEYSTDCNYFLANATIVLKEVELDIKSCFSFSEKFSSEWVESKIESCKLDLAGQHLL